MWRTRSLPRPSITGRIEQVPIDYTIEFRGTNDRGAEVVIYLVSEAEGKLGVSNVAVEYAVDGTWYPRKAVYFHAADRHGNLELEQFVVAEGHFHISDLGSAVELRTRLFMEFDDNTHVDHAKVSQRLKTRSFRRR